MLGLYCCKQAFSRCCKQAFSRCSKRGLLFFVLLGLLIAVAFLVAEHKLWGVWALAAAVPKLQSTDSKLWPPGLAVLWACGIFPDQGWTSVPCFARRTLNRWTTREAPGEKGLISMCWSQPAETSERVQLSGVLVPRQRELCSGIRALVGSRQQSPASFISSLASFAEPWLDCQVGAAFPSTIWEGALSFGRHTLPSCHHVCLSRSGDGFLFPRGRWERWQPGLVLLLGRETPGSWFTGIQGWQWWSRDWQVWLERRREMTLGGLVIAPVLAVGHFWPGRDCYSLRRGWILCRSWSVWQKPLQYCEVISLQLK